MPVTTEIDTNNAFDWAERTTNEYTLFSTLYKDVTTTFDDGHIEVENYRNDVLTRFTLTDPTDALPIQEQTIVYGTDGVIRSSDTLDDENQRTEITYENGIVLSETKTDEGDARAWTTIDIQFENGEIDSFKINYDPSNTLASTADDSSSVNFLNEIQYDADNTEDWMFIVNGRSGTRNWTYVFDDQGGQTRESFDNGIIDTRNEFDYGDVEDWARIYTIFDAAGVIETRFTTLDDGSNFIESFDDGTLTRTRMQDDGGNFDYRFIETFFDSDGNAIRRETQPDSGSLIVEILRETSTVTDDANLAAWSEITTVTDGDGALIERETIYDNGNTRFDSFDAGTLAERTTTEADGDTSVQTYVDGSRTSLTRSDVSDTKSWDSLRNDYDSNGQIAAKSVSYDNGTNTAMTYSDGVIQTKTRTDVNDSFGWDSIVFNYADGALVNRTTTYDNADGHILVYENQVKSAQLRIDGDDSNNWVVQLTEYDSSGKTVSSYDAFDDVPAEYALLLTGFDDMIIG